MSSTPNTSSFPDGMPEAQPEYLVDATGTPVSPSNPLNVNASFSASQIAIGDKNTPANTQTVDSSGNAHVLEANSAAEKSDLDTIVTQTSNVAKETGGNLAAVK